MKQILNLLLILFMALGLFAIVFAFPDLVSTLALISNKLELPIFLNKYSPAIKLGLIFTALVIISILYYLLIKHIRSKSRIAYVFVNLIGSIYGSIMFPKYLFPILSDTIGDLFVKGTIGNNYKLPIQGYLILFSKHSIFNYILSVAFYVLLIVISFKFKNKIFCGQENDLKFLIYSLIKKLREIKYFFKEKFTKKPKLEKEQPIIFEKEEKILLEEMKENEKTENEFIKDIDKDRFENRYNSLKYNSIKQNERYKNRSLVIKKVMKEKLKEKLKDKSDEEQSKEKIKLQDQETDKEIENDTFKFGKAGEDFIFEYEKKLYGGKFSDMIIHESDKNPFSSYDILSYDENGNKKYIEVKTTDKFFKTGFFLSKKEKDFLLKNKNSFLYRVYNFDTDSKTGKIKKITPEELKNNFWFIPEKFLVVPKKNIYHLDEDE